MPLRNWINSSNNAIEGILHAAKTQKHLRYHLYSASAVLMLSYMLGINRTDFLIIAVAVVLVLLAEMVNTAVEYIVDMISPEYSENARIAKDISAGAVLITAFGAALIGYIILFPYLSGLFEKGIHIAKHSKQEITLISVVLILIIVIVLKSHFGKGHPLSGGMPSGHAAMAFAFWAAITYGTENFTASFLTFIMAVFIAQNRVTVGVHRPAEVVAGAAIGAGITFFLYFIFR